MSTQMMGFESDKRIRQQWNNQPQNATIDGKHYHFRSKLEARWAKYCQFRKEQGLIKDWAYEQTRFLFPGETRGAVQYLIDFDILNNDGTFHYEECKGRLTGKDNTKFRRVRKYRPEVEIDLVMQRIPKKHSGTLRIAAKYTRRIIDASKIFRQLGL